MDLLSEHQKKELNEALEQVQSGKVISNEAVKEKIKLKIELYLKK